MGGPTSAWSAIRRQAIYGWNGSDHTTMTEVERRFPGVTVVALTTNYRCSPQIVRTGTAALVAADIADDTQSMRGDGRCPRSFAAPDDAAEAATVSAIVRDLVQRHGPRNLAVLAETTSNSTL